MGNYLNIRWGKTYRPFGLYNEILDAVPTYIGIEPPEIFDKDHLMLTRTTNLMVHGSYSTGPHSFTYAFTTGNDQREGNEVPLGADLHYDFGTMVRIGTSYYDTRGPAVASRSVGEGSPRGGVATWMVNDDYQVYGGYLQVHYRGLTIQTETWIAAHDAERDPEQVLLLLDADLNPRQLKRFGLDGANPSASDIPTEVTYKVRTTYVRVGYGHELESGMEIIPYVQWDFYRNPELVGKKKFGGDNEAGLSDNGEFVKATVGVVMRPIPEVALKVDVSQHRQKFNGKDQNYAEIRTSFSYLWSL